MRRFVKKYGFGKYLHLVRNKFSLVFYLSNVREHRTGQKRGTISSASGILMRPRSRALGAQNKNKILFGQTVFTVLKQNGRKIGGKTITAVKLVIETGVFAYLIGQASQQGLS